MKIKLSFRIPAWIWVTRLIERFHPGALWRLDRWGRTTETKWGGVVTTKLERL
jgi:hypothetical protein